MRNPTSFLLRLNGGGSLGVQGRVKRNLKKRKVTQSEEGEKARRQSCTDSRTKGAKSVNEAGKQAFQRAFSGNKNLPKPPFEVKIRLMESRVFNDLQHQIISRMYRFFRLTCYAAELGPLSSIDTFELR